MTEFRTAVPADRDSLYRVWAACFDAPHVVALYESEPGRYRRTFVAAGDDGIHSVVYYVPRRIRNATGGTDLVGGVANVATRPDARGRGHIKRLLDLAVTAMAAEGCAWSLLFTGTPGVYASAGWSTFELRHPSGTLVTPGPPGPRTRIRTRTVGLDTWPVLADLYERHNARRPLTTVREPGDWRLRIPVWYGPPVELTVTERDGEPIGYLAARWHADSVEILEVAGDEAAVFDDVTARAARRGVAHGRARLPADAIGALPHLFGDVRYDPDTTGMVRPITSNPTGIVRAPTAIHWSADYF